MKIANELGHAGCFEPVRGRGGGITLACEPYDTNLAAVIRLMEPGCPMVDCSSCRLARRCRLPGILGEASLALHAVVKKFTHAHVIGQRNSSHAPRPASSGIRQIPPYFWQPLPLRPPLTWMVLPLLRVQLWAVVPARGLPTGRPE
jgi:DNA-binding IscR family transcriptional regulator